MSSSSDLVNDLVDNYPHRNIDSIGDDIEASEILSGYLESQGVDGFEWLDSDFPYHAALGRTADTEGQLVLTTRYTFPDEDGFARDFIQACLEADNLDQILEENIIRDGSVIDAAGANLIEDKKASTVDGEALRPETVHCVVFYDSPVITATEDMDYESLVHEQAATEALSEASLATAVIHSGRSDGEDYAAAQIDYWTRSFDGIDGGLDYTSINWKDSEL